MTMPTHCFSSILILLFFNEFVYLYIGGSLVSVPSVHRQAEENNVPRQHSVATQLVLVQVWQRCDTEGREVGFKSFHALIIASEASTIQCAHTSFSTAIGHFQAL